MGPCTENPSVVPRAAIRLDTALARKGGGPTFLGTIAGELRRQPATVHPPRLQSRQRPSGLGHFRLSPASQKPFKSPRIRW